MPDKTNVVKIQTSGTMETILRVEDLPMPYGAAEDLLDVCLGMQDLIDRCGVQVNQEFQRALLAAISKAEKR